MACKVLVVCGSPVVASADLLRQLAGECDHIVAVDRGLDALLGAGLSCDVYVATPTPLAMRDMFWSMPLPILK